MAPANPNQATLAISSDQAQSLFGSLGTHSFIAGATLWLRDPFFSDRLGRKVSVSAASRSTAMRAIRIVLFQLLHDANITTQLKDSNWMYYDDKGVIHGPFSFSKMVGWARKNAFKNEALRVQHTEAQCWLPLWFLVESDDLLLLNNNNNGDSQLSYNTTTTTEVMMMDADEAVQDVLKERSGGALTVKNTSNVEDFPELSTQEAPEPMDYDLSHAPTDMAKDAVKVFVVVDTNVLMSHMSFTEKAFEDLRADGSRAEVLLIVPWVVLNELDKLKDSHKSNVSDGARRALKRLRVLTGERDGFIHAQTAAEHEQAVGKIKLPDIDSTVQRQLHNDDMILQSCLYTDGAYVEPYRRMGHCSAVFLLSNDSGLCLRAKVCGIKCFSAFEFPRDAEVLAKEVPEAQPVAIDDLESSKPETASTPSPPATASVTSTTPPSPPAMNHQHHQHQAAAIGPEDALKLLMMELEQCVKNNKPPSPKLIEFLQSSNNNPAVRAYVSQKMAMFEQESKHAQHAQHVQQQHHAVAHQQQQQQALQMQQLQQQLRQQAVINASSSSSSNAPPQSQMRPPVMPMSQMHPALQQQQQQQQQQRPAPSMQQQQQHMQLPTVQSQQQKPSLSLNEAYGELKNVMETCLATAIKYYRQQDLGDMWLEMLDDDELPPWKAQTVSHFLAHHNSTFWGILSKDGIDDAKRLPRLVRQLEGGLNNTASGIDGAVLSSAVGIVLRLLNEMSEASGKPKVDAGEAPDPSQVPDFVSLGEARAAMAAGIERVARLLLLK